jgi:hypothetical protein
MKKFSLIFLFLGISLFSLSADNDNSYRPQLFYSTDQDIIAFADIRGNIIEYNAVTMAEKVYNNPLALTNERVSHPRVTIDCENKVSIVMTDQGLSAWYYTTGKVKSLPEEIPLNKIRDICFSPTGEIVYFLVQFAGLVEYDLEAMRKTVTDLVHKIELCFYSFNSLPYIGVSWCDPGGGGTVDFYSLPDMKYKAMDWKHGISGGERHSSKISRSDFFVANNSYNRFFEVYKTVLSNSKIEFNKILRIRRSYKIYSFSPDENYIAVLKDPNTVGVIYLHKPDEEMTELKYGKTEILDFVWTVNNTFVCLNTDFELEVVDIPLF